MIGGTLPGAGNQIATSEFDGVHIRDASNNVVQGNLIGTDATGTQALGNGNNGVVIVENANNNLIGGTTPGARNIISGNVVGGVGIATQSMGNIVRGNFVGTDVTGAQPLGNNIGVFVFEASDNIIGGEMPGAGNVIAANVTNGVEINGSSTSNNRIEGNFIGTESSGMKMLGNGASGIAIFNEASENMIKGNVISNNDLVGIRFVVNGSGNAILSNSIHSNGGIGIDLLGDGITVNDEGDQDTGPNGLQNFPILTSLTVNDGSVNIEGSLNSISNVTFILEFFSNPACDPSGHGEGERFVGSTIVSTNINGNINFTANFPAMDLAGDWITATATDSTNNTSEFSKCALLTGDESN